MPMAASPSGALPQAAPSPLEALPMAASPSGALPQAAPSPRAAVLSAGAFPTCPRPGRRGASREKASITPRIAEGADNITSGANNDNSTSDNPPPPIVPPPGEECFRLKNYQTGEECYQPDGMMFVDMFVAMSGCCEPRSTICLACIGMCRFVSSFTRWRLQRAVGLPEQQGIESVQGVQQQAASCFRL